MEYIISRSQSNKALLLMALTSELQDTQITSCDLVHKSAPEKQVWLFIQSDEKLYTAPVPPGKWELYGTLSEFSADDRIADNDAQLLADLGVSNDRCFVLQTVE